MEAWLADNDKIMFYKYLDNSKIYFEYGSGGSTYQASNRENIQVIYSVESDKIWHDKLKKLVKHKNIKFIFNEMDVKPNTGGNPGPNSTKIQRVNYSNQLLGLDKNAALEIDLILIDGRFRAACCLKSFDVISNDCLIAFDDFLNRSQYHIVLNYFDIIEKTQDNRMVILKKKIDISSVEKEIIEKYEMIRD